MSTCAEGGFKSHVKDEFKKQKDQKPLIAKLGREGQTKQSKQEERYEPRSENGLALPWPVLQVSGLDMLLDRWA